MTSTASAALIPFTGGHEGFVSKAYRDPGGVITIGYGFTGLSTIFAAYWKAKYGHALRMGDTITRAEADAILAKLIAQEYAPPVAMRFPDAILQHQFDAAVDVSFNCGPRSLKWKWAEALASGLMGTAAARLRTTATTAGGKKLAGLVRRRADEARLIETGDYGQGSAPASQSVTLDDVKAYQADLMTLGLYPGPVDGIAASSHAAVMMFQQDNDLFVDGVVGPATRAALRRVLDAKEIPKTAAVGAGSGAVIGATTTDIATHAPTSAPNIPSPDVPAFDWHPLITAIEWALVIGVLAFAASLAWRYRGVIFKRRTPA